MKLRVLVYAVRIALGIPVPRGLMASYFLTDRGKVIFYPYYTVLS